MDATKRDELYLWLIEQAVKAPSGHNTQPWLFRLDTDGIEIHPNYERSLPVVDPQNRELFISLGCAVENLVMAASEKGLASVISVDDRGSIFVRFEPDQTIEPDLLIDQLSIRQTNRNLYDGKLIPEDVIQTLQEMQLPEDIKIHYYKKDSEAFDLITDLIQEGNRIQMGNKDFVRELRGWMRLNKQHQDQTNDGLSYAVFGAPNLPLFMVKPIMTALLNPKIQNQSDLQKIKSSSHLVLFTTVSDNLTEWISTGRALQRFLLQSTALGLANAYMNQPIEVPALKTRIMEDFTFAEHPQMLLRIGYCNQIAYSKRRAVSEVIIR